MKKVEFSKKIFITVAIVNILVVVFVCFMVYMTSDTSPLTPLITAVAAETATGTGFYYNKAKAENKIKLMRDNNITPTEKYFKGDTYDDDE